MGMTRRELALFGGAGMVALAAQAVGASPPLPVGAAAFDPTPFVHPELRFLVPAFLKFKTGGTLSSETLGQLRKMLGGGAPDPAARAVRVPGRSGAPDVLAYVLNGTASGAVRPAILYVHGGGFVAGNAASKTGELQQLARDLDCVIVAVDYRLAPETQFPGPLEDCYAALTWLYRNAQSLGVDRRRIAVMGESAGGGLAAMLSIAARDRREVPILFQSLIYPMLDDRTGSTRAVQPPLGSLTWDSAANRFGWTSFLGVAAGSAHVPPGSVPARVERLTGLPRTFIGVGSIDLFVSEDVEYAQRLISEAVPTELLVVPGAFHGFNGAAPNAGVSRQFNTAVKLALQNAFASTW